jgi:hypothetical protein
MSDGAIERRLSDVVDRLTTMGYPDSFRGEPGGIVDLRSGVVHDPEDLSIEAAERFEGTTDPGDEAMVLALSCRRHGCRGTYVVPYGETMSGIDAELVVRIPDGRRR